LQGSKLLKEFYHRQKVSFTARAYVRYIRTSFFKNVRTYGIGVIYFTVLNLN